VFKYNSKDSLIEKTFFDTEQNIIYQTNWEYDSNGNKITETSLNSENRIVYRYTWDYNKANKLIEEKHFQSNDYTTSEYDSIGNQIVIINHEPISLSATKLIKYDDNGRLIEEETIDESKGSWKIQFSYWGNNKIKEEIMYNTNNLMTLKWGYNYHKNGQVSEKINYDISEGGKETHIAFKYYYDEEGREIDNIYYDAQGSITSQDTKKYNKNGDLIEYSLYTSDATMTGVFRYAYKYDNKNNLIEKIEYWNEYPNTITERKIEYYN